MLDQMTYHFVLRGQLNRLKHFPLGKKELLTSILKNKERPLAEEVQWLDKIENLRKSLVNDFRPLNVIDYGAGSPWSRTLKNLTNNGKKQTRSVSEVCQIASKTPVWAHLLFRIIRVLKPKLCLELGTSLGISALYQAAALEMNQAGLLITLEGSPPQALLARNHFIQLQLAHRIRSEIGKFQEQLPSVLSSLKSQIDYAFIDGHHLSEAALNYFQQILPYLSNRAVIILDDISWLKMKKAWRVISGHPAVTTPVDLFHLGICFIQKGKD